MRSRPRATRRGSAAATRRCPCPRSVLCSGGLAGPRACGLCDARLGSGACQSGGFRDQAVIDQLHTLSKGSQQRGDRREGGVARPGLNPRDLALRYPRGLRQVALGQLVLPAALDQLAREADSSRNCSDSRSRAPCRPLPASSRCAASCLATPRARPYPYEQPNALDTAFTARRACGEPDAALSLGTVGVAQSCRGAMGERQRRWQWCS
jgi:hypothetical protein